MIHEQRGATTISERERKKKVKANEYLNVCQCEGTLTVPSRKKGLSVPVKMRSIELPYVSIKRKLTIVKNVMERQDAPMITLPAR